MIVKDDDKELQNSIKKFSKIRIDLHKSTKKFFSEKIEEDMEDISLHKNSFKEKEDVFTKKKTKGAVNKKLPEEKFSDPTFLSRLKLTYPKGEKKEEPKIINIYRNEKSKEFPFKAEISFELEEIKEFQCKSLVQENIKKLEECLMPICIPIES